ncbi:MAG: methionine synthase [Spirochaetaceae bacterium]|jgi:5-methyltetrahydrofolate--homocysteine methyltransferase|nr:methionine synthase [Spirochaetaceae bacterium]
MSVRQKLDEIAKRRILLLDGAMGTMLQRHKLGEADFRGSRFAAHQEKLAGCNDLLCLTKPDLITAIHTSYLEAGADIIETCSFNANAISLSDYALAPLAYELSRAAAELATSAVRQFSTEEAPRFVVGVLGPLSKSASISPDIDDPAKRSVGFDEIAAAYYDNARGLLDGGADILMLETVFDTLNAKAGIAAVLRLMDERQIDIPLMISAAIADAAGRILAGQTVEAFCVSILHAARANHTGLFSVGLNCSLGAEMMQPFVSALAKIAPLAVSAHPNAGLPNESGGYDESPQAMAQAISAYIDAGLVNIVGGCCGSTPEHIKAIYDSIQGRAPRIFSPPTSPPKKTCGKLFLSGLEVAVIDHDTKLFLCGEKGNVPGNRKLAGYIQDGKLEEAVRMVRENIEQGVDAIDISMDDPLIDAKTMIVRFLNLSLSDPAIARVPFIIDSSDFEVLEAALKCLQGKAIANSISLKEGEAEFLRKARRVRDLGAIPMVMLFDEAGQAASEERKVEIAKRAYQLLLDNNFPREEIIFDPNVLSIVTGIEEHDRYALDFINACRIITAECPWASISAGVSNLSYSFRGNAIVRNAMHAHFLQLCYEAGLSAAIVNYAAIELYRHDTIESELKTAIDDALLCKKNDAGEVLLNLAKSMKRPSHSESKDERALGTGCGATRQRISAALISGLDSGIEDDVRLLIADGALPLEIIEGPLMAGMKEVSERFGRGDMFLPEVIRSARVMRKAVAVLEPLMRNEHVGARRRDKIVLATVKGDVHDIGKNIVGTVLGCNGFEIIDLGVMVSAEKIVEAARKEGARIVGLSGLVTPSLAEMCDVAKLMETHKLDVPLLVGGATTSLVHTALKINTCYSAPVVYVPDAGAAPEAARSLLSESLRTSFLAKLQAAYDKALVHHNALEAARQTIPLEVARKNKFFPYGADWNFFPPQKNIPTGTEYIADYPLEKIVRFIDWESWARKLDTDKQKNRSEWKKLKSDGEKMLSLIQKEKLIKLCGAVRFYPALSEDEDIILYDTSKGTRTEILRFCFPRNQIKKQEGRANPSLADFILPLSVASEHQTDYIGLFVLSAGVGVEEAKKRFLAAHDNYSAIILSTLADSLAEAFSERTHRRVGHLYGKGIRPAFGYPCSPDHSDKKAVFKLLDIKNQLPLSLTSSAMIKPAASVCGMYIFNPASYYFSCGAIGGDQLEILARKKRMSVEEARKRMMTL